MQRMTTLAVLYGCSAVEEDGRIFTHVSFGRIVEELAGRFGRIRLCVPTVDRRGPAQDYGLPANVELVPLETGSTALANALAPGKIVPAYGRAMDGADAIFVRGVMIGAIRQLYNLAAQRNIPVVHWMVGNPMALLRSHRRYGWLRDTVGKLFVRWWEHNLKLGHRRTGNLSALLCNGSEIARRFPGCNTKVVVSTTLVDDDFHFRHDTCQDNPITVLSLCFIRPEKGIEYLIRAFANLQTTRPAELVLVGGRDRYPSYQRKLDNLVESLDLGDRVSFAGHAEYRDIPSFLQQADVFVLPTLSEGTPRTLVEARANCTPVVSTTVGGIPDSVTHGHDGLLVPPKNPDALAEAIDQLIEDGQLRRNLIAEGYKRVGDLTVPRFVDSVLELLDDRSTA